jgi:hypothetical protein
MTANKPWETELPVVKNICDEYIKSMAQLLAARALYEAMERERVINHAGNDCRMRQSASYYTHNCHACAFEKLLWPEGRKANG